VEDDVLDGPGLPFDDLLGLAVGDLFRVGLIVDQRLAREVDEQDDDDERKEPRAGEATEPAFLGSGGIPQAVSSAWATSSSLNTPT